MRYDNYNGSLGVKFHRPELCSPHYTIASTRHQVYTSSLLSHIFNLYFLQCTMNVFEAFTEFNICYSLNVTYSKTDHEVFRIRRMISATNISFINNTLLATALSSEIKIHIRYTSVFGTAFVLCLW